MARIALWGPMILVGLAGATLSSALGSILVAPRTLQALAADEVTPWPAVNRFLAAGSGRENEPRNGTGVTALLALATVASGSIDFVARIVSMFFMVTYGTLCAISFLEHFAARPSYRPTFRSKWYLSLLGAVLCGLLMFQMDPGYALLSIGLMVATYLGLRAHRGGEDDLAEIFRGVMAQTTRHFQIRLQRYGAAPRDWRPNLIVVSEHTFDRTAPLQLLAWICRRQGFGTWLHLIRGRLDHATQERRRKIQRRLFDLSLARENGLIVDSMVSPSMRTALAQAFQIPSATGRSHNATLFDIPAHHREDALSEVVDGCTLAWEAGLSPLVLRHEERFFGARRSAHLWLTWHDYDNAPLMILTLYVLLGHPDWRSADVRIFAAFPKEDAEREQARLIDLIESGRLPISRKNLTTIPTDGKTDFEQLVAARSGVADLVLLGFTRKRLELRGADLLLRHPTLGEVLFVSAAEAVVME